jgi:hypothetical protein
MFVFEGDKESEKEMKTTHLSSSLSVLSTIASFFVCLFSSSIVCLSNRVHYQAFQKSKKKRGTHKHTSSNKRKQGKTKTKIHRNPISSE